MLLRQTDSIVAIIFINKTWHPDVFFGHCPCRAAVSLTKKSACQGRLCQGGAMGAVALFSLANFLSIFSVLLLFRPFLADLPSLSSSSAGFHGVGPYFRCDHTV